MLLLPGLETRASTLTEHLFLVPQTARALWNIMKYLTQNDALVNPHRQCLMFCESTRYGCFVQYAKADHLFTSLGPTPVFPLDSRTKKHLPALFLKHNKFSWSLPQYMLKYKCKSNAHSLLHTHTHTHTHTQYSIVYICMLIYSCNTAYLT
jgi:hypothetical protein